MDPVANLREQRDLARKLISAHDSGDEVDPADAARLAELVQALDEWRLRGGFDPYERWSARAPVLGRWANDA